jgi:WhiB family redox-sensing transcriptional regulator
MENLFSDDYPDFQEFGPPPCSGSFPDAFFPDDVPDGNTAIRPGYRYEYESKMTCFSCDYQARCLTYALKHPEEQGIWGGTTEKDRRNIKRGYPVRMALPRKK